MRERSIRFVLVVAVLTTIATSAPKGFVREDGDARMLAPRDVVRVRVVYSAAASEQAETMRIEFRWSGSGPAMLVPDDPALPAVQLVQRHDIDALEPCMAAGTCELGFTIDAGDANGMLEVSATAERGGDPSFCFPDNRDFVGDSTVEVLFE